MTELLLPPDDGLISYQFPHQFSLESYVKSGFVFREYKSFFGVKWQRTYLQLKGTTIEVFPPDGTTVKPLLSIPVSCCVVSTILRQSQNCVQITGEEDLDITFYTSSFKENDDWLVSLKCAQCLAKYMAFCELDDLTPDEELLQAFSPSSLRDLVLVGKIFPVSIFSTLHLPLELARIRKIVIQNCGLTNESLAYFEEPLIASSLLEVDFSDNLLSESGGNILGKILARSLSIIKLNVSGNNLGDLGVEGIATGLVSHHVFYEGKQISLLFLGLSRVNLTSKGIQLLSDVLVPNFLLGNMETITIKELDLSNNSIGDYGIKNFKPIIYSSCISELNLSNCSVSKLGTELFSLMLGTNSSIKKLNLSEWKFNSKSMLQFIKSVRNHQELKQVELNNCEIESEALELFFSWKERVVKISKLIVNRSEAIIP
ncbi:hypothetical protein RCL1_007791 [Eukaryota sp. TZLM3-RCL]